MATTASVYNLSRTARQVLKRHKKEPSSLILHLHINHVRFEKQNGILLPDGPVKCFLRAIREQRVPSELIDLFNEAHVPFFEGCLIVEIHDHRPKLSFQDSDPSNPSASLQSSIRSVAGQYGVSASRSSQYQQLNDVNSDSASTPGSGGGGGPEIYRIVLHPTSESLYTDLRLLDESLGGTWVDEDVLEIESKILTLTTPPLCLTPDPMASRIANLMLSATALPSSYSPSLSSNLPLNRGKGANKRGFNSLEVEEEEREKRTREKIMRFMDPSSGSLGTSAVGGGGSGGTGSKVGNGSSSGGGAMERRSNFVPTFGRMTFIESWRAGKSSGQQGDATPQRNLNGTASSTPSVAAIASGSNPNQRNQAHNPGMNGKNAHLVNGAGSPTLSQAANAQTVGQAQAQSQSQSQDPNQSQVSATESTTKRKAAPKKYKKKGAAGEREQSVATTVGSPSAFGSPEATPAAESPPPHASKTVEKASGKKKKNTGESTSSAAADKSKGKGKGKNKKADETPASTSQSQPAQVSTPTESGASATSTVMNGAKKKKKLTAKEMREEKAKQAEQLIQNSRNPNLNKNNNEVSFSNLNMNGSSNFNVNGNLNQSPALQQQAMMNHNPNFNQPQGIPMPSYQSQVPLPPQFNQQPNFNLTNQNLPPQFGQPQPQPNFNVNGFNAMGSNDLSGFGMPMNGNLNGMNSNNNNLNGINMGMNGLPFFGNQPGGAGGYGGQWGGQ